MKLSSLYYLATFLLATCSGRFSYDGYKVYQVVLESVEEAEVLSEFENDEAVDFWSDVRSLDVPVDVMVSPSGQSRFESVLESENIEYSVLIEDVEEKVQEEDERLSRATTVDSGAVSFTEFMRHDEVNTRLPRSTRARLSRHRDNGGDRKSFEGRNLTVAKISSGGEDKPIIFIEAAIHAREWIAPPVALYTLNQLVENETNSEMYRDVDWIIHPVVNPDGYEYSHTDERLWRKTRTPGTICDGVDGNRNFDYQWMLTGASSWQCTQTYAGYKAFSEVETQAVGDLFAAYKGRIKLFVDVHSYGQLLLYPYGFTDDPPDNVDELLELGLRFNASVSSVRGTTYSVGNSLTLLYAVAGGSRDYAYAVGEVDLTYTLELPAGGSSGFNPEESEILPVVTETWEGIKTFYEHIQEKYVTSEVTDNTTTISTVSEEYKVYKVIPKSLDEAKLLMEFQNDENFDFWSDLRTLDRPVDIMVTPMAQLRFVDILKSENIEYSVHIDNVEEIIQEERQRKKRSTLIRGAVSFTEFMRHDDINAYLAQLATDYPDIVTTETIGKSFEGRNLTLIKISSGAGGSTKPAIYFQAAIHAREWIAPPVALYMINQLVENENNSALYQDVDWMILPVVNPDGYEYSHDSVRLWRKTRTPGTICDGVDGNRNFDYQWMTTGASSWQCTQTYAGHKAFSEVETQAVGAYFQAHAHHIRLVELQTVGDRVNDAIYAVRGTNYSVGNSNILLYATSGSVPDYAKGAAGIELAYTLELPAGSVSGFVPTVDEIQPVVEETWEGIKVFHEYIVEKFVN
ncbi:hypothetical protein NQ318_010819 [Aromia moschata]|uniref:Zinc carboxypeptidase A 1 n=1 Tax=Aromia moschata TaxID=1265417 RepID=A0AAV8YJD1_9CUCU|nr:hypothetical protein NQ318_010819 [Aromia moschata]